MASIVKRKRSILWFIHTPMRTATSVRSGKPLKRMPKQRKGSCRLNMSRSPNLYSPSAKTVNDLLDEYMSIYGVNTWAMSTYESRKSLIANYIRPSSVI